MIIDLHQDISVKLLEKGIQDFLSPAIQRKNRKIITYGRYGLIDQADYPILYNNQYKLIFGASCALDLTVSGISLPKNPLNELLTHINSYLNLAKRSDNKIVIVKNLKDLKNIKENQLAFLLSIEGLYCIQSTNDLKIIDNVYNLGVRCIGPFWNLENPLGGTAHNTKRITKLGTEVIKYLNYKNIIIDGSHASSQSLEDIIKISTKPIAISHALAKDVLNHPRNLEDKHIKMICNSGGIIGICFISEFAGKKNIESLIYHIKHLARIGSINNIAIGSDFGAMFESSLITRLEDATKIKNLVNKLRRCGFKTNDIEKILWKNALTFLSKNLVS